MKLVSSGLPIWPARGWGGVEVRDQVRFGDLDLEEGTIAGTGYNRKIGSVRSTRPTGRMTVNQKGKGVAQHSRTLRLETSRGRHFHIMHGSVLR